MSENFFALGLGIGTKNKNNAWLETFFPQPLLKPEANITNELVSRLSLSANQNNVIELDSSQLEKIIDLFEGQSIFKDEQNLQVLLDSEKPKVLVLLKEDTELSDVPSAYLKLQLISHRLVKPHEIKLDKIFGALPNVAWTNQGAIDLDELPAKQFQAKALGQFLEVQSVDKFPKMTDYVVPKGVRIADTARVRLGAYLGEGTTVMHEGFINFNAGCMGPNMIEGRISAGVIVGEGSDLGGGCSTMGTLSGGNNVIISIGKNCLLGANAGTGIPLGDSCTIEAGLYITASSKVNILDENKNVVQQIKASELAFKPNLLFRRNSQSGVIECLTNKSSIELNAELHANN